jgi:uncharacterized repeat protein (TIGR03803 family)
LSDGLYPVSSLVYANGALYGTTTGGGAYGWYFCCIGYPGGYGTAFKVDGFDKETVLHYFAGQPDGETPESGLVDLNGTLCGTTALGGANDQGTVYSISPAGAYKTVYSFRGKSFRDGASPEAALIVVNGDLFGTTAAGGAGFGTVFELTPGGTETVLYRFTGDADGGRPTASLTSVNGLLYGTAEFGGIYGAYSRGGVVFKIDKPGIESVVHYFGHSGDGANPMSELLYLNGELYGTTSGGGFDCGIAYQVSPAGAYQRLHVFNTVSDHSACRPVGGLVAIDGTIYGTTQEGGNYPNAFGAGTIYAITP